MKRRNRRMELASVKYRLDMRAEDFLRVMIREKVTIGTETKNLLLSLTESLTYILSEELNRYKETDKEQEKLKLEENMFR